MSEIMSSSIENSDNNEKQEIIEMKKRIENDQEVILYLTYLTTLARLPDNRDLDELFDGEIQLGEEEMLAVYSLIEMLNGKNTISVLKTPKKMYLDRNWAQDYKYELFYDDIKNGKRIKSIEGTGTLPLNTTKLNFFYDKFNKVNKLIFERPTNLNFKNGGFGVDQEVSIKRLNGLVNELQIMRKGEIDNKISIKYNKFAKPELIEQTKLGLLSDKIIFEYDKDRKLKTIIYLPSLSLKHLKAANLKGGKGEIIVNGVLTTFKHIKRMSSSDVIELTYENGKLKSTKTKLGSSRWFNENGFSESKYDKDGKLKELYLEKEEIGPDDKKDIIIEY